MHSPFASSNGCASSRQDVPLDRAPPEDLGAVFDLTLWLYPGSDAPELFERLASSSGWRLQPDDTRFLTARWEPGDEGFLAERAVRSAELTYRCWTSPRRR
jgi:hypothetical protein